jgi:hypothetical protein
MPQRRVAGLLAAIVLAGALGAACSGESGSTTKAPEGFCQAAYNYEQELNKELTKGEKNLTKQLALVEKMADQAPKKIRGDATAFADALRRLPHDPSVKNNPEIKKAVDNVNRYASNGCGFFKQDPSQGL